MGMYDELGHWDSYDDDRQSDPIYEEFDSIKHTTDKAVLYTIRDHLFWLPKSVHHIHRKPKNGKCGIVMIEGWAIYNKFKEQASTKKPVITANKANKVLTDLDFDDKCDFTDEI